MNPHVSSSPRGGAPSSDRTKIVGSVAGEGRKVVAQPGIGLCTSHARQKLCFGQPTPTLRPYRAEHRDGAALDSDSDVFSGLDAAKHSRRVIAQVTSPNFDHATNVLHL